MVAWRPELHPQLHGLVRIGMERPVRIAELEDQFARRVGGRVVAGGIIQPWRLPPKAKRNQQNQHDRPGGLSYQSDCHETSVLKCYGLAARGRQTCACLLY